MKDDISKNLMSLSSKVNKEKKYWLNKLSGELIKTHFPYDFNKADTTQQEKVEDRADKIESQWPQDLVLKLNRITNRSDNNLYTILLAGLTLLLYKYTGHTDILIGAPIYKQAVEGDFINTVLIIRNRFSQEETFKELILQVKKNLAEANDHLNYPIERLLFHLDIPTSDHGEGFSIFETVILLENIHDRKYIRDITPRFLLSFSQKEDQFIKGVVEYNARLYKKETIQRIMTHLMNLLQGIEKTINQTISGIDILSEEEQRQLLFDFNNTRADYPGDKTIRQLFEEQAEKTPGSTAVVCPIDNNSLEYRELNEKSHQLAGVIREKGIKPGTVAAVMAEPSVEMTIGILAVLKAGGAYLPINPDSPHERIRYILAGSNAGILLTTRSVLLTDKPRFDTHVIYIEDQVEHEQITAVRNLQPLALPSDPVYVIYTSGTTGKPKGVLITNQNLVNYTSWLSKALELTTEDRTVLTSSFSFDLGYSSIYGALLNGGQLHLLSLEQYIFSETLLNYIKENQITFLKITPSLFSLMVHSPDFSMETCASLRVVLLGGESIVTADVELAHRRCSHIRVMNHYGPTEATIGCIAQFIDFDTFEQYKKNPTIGKPISNTSAYILAKNLKPLPIGAPGELTISGACLARGYLNRADITSDKFLRNPYIPGERMYRTGDLARDLPNGNIEFLGRIDNQVKIRGYRIELGEIETQLLKHQNIEEAFVITAKKNPVSAEEDKYLCAYIVPKKGELKKEKEPLLSLKEIEIKENLIEATNDSAGFEKEDVNQSIVSYFESQVTRCSDKIAVKLNNKSLTYDLLNRHSNQIARIILEKYDDRYKLSKAEKVRYGRQMLLHGWGAESQEKLKSTTVFVAGAGGGASPTITQLALAGFGTLIVCDCDDVELSNLNRQFLHDESRIGMNKALSAKMTINRLNPNIKVIAHTQKLTRENVFDLVGDSDIVFDMFDELESKFILAECTVVKEIPHIVSAMTDMNAYTAVFHTPKTPCFFCIFDKNKLEEITAAMKNFDDTYEKEPLPVVSASLFTATGFAVNEAIKIILGFENFAYNKYFLFNQRKIENIIDTDGYRAMTYLYSDHFRKLCKEQGFDWDVGGSGNFLQELTIEKDPGCPVCGEKGKEKLLSISREHKIKERKIEEEVGTISADQKGRLEQDNKTNGNRQVTALLLGHDADMVKGMIGVLKSGKMYVPLNPIYPEERLSAILEESEARLILTDNDNFSLAGKIKNKVNKSIPIVNINEIDESIPLENLSVKINLDQAAYTLYHPDPTGKLEEVSQTHEDVLHFIRLYSDHLDSDPTHSLTPLSAYNFDAAMMDIYATILNGNTYHPANNKPGKKSHSLSELKEYLSRTLPEYMIPSYFIMLDRIPLTPNGKIDRKALPDPEIGIGAGYIAPRNELEEKLVDIWADVLEREKETIGIDSNFFDLGGQSLKATLLVARIHRELDVRLPIGEIFRTPMIRELSQYIEGTIKEKFFAIVPAEKKEYYPLSSAQNRLYFINLMEPDSTAYNVPSIMVLEGDIDRNKLKDAFRELIKRHESLRTSYMMLEEASVQRVHDTIDGDFAIEYYEDGEEVEKIVHNFVRPFDLSKAPQLRAGLVKEREERFIFMVDRHHIMTDGISRGILERDFMSLYAGNERPPLKLHYKDFSQWQNQLLHSGVINKQEEYWINRFKGDIPTLNLPTDYPRTLVRSSDEGALIDYTIDKELTAALKETLKETGTTQFMFMLAVYNVLLAKYSGQADIVVGSPVNGRRHSDLETIIGLFINMLSFRNRPAEDKSFKEFLEDVKKNALNAYENQDFQFEELVSKLGLQGITERTPLFSVVFADMNLEAPEIENPQLALQHYGLEKTTSKFDLRLSVAEYGDIIEMTLTYSTALFKRTTAERMIKRFIEILQQVLENRDIKLKDIAISHDLVVTKSNSLQDYQETFDF